MKKFLKRYASITLGTLVTAVALDLFLIPNRLAVGGVSGLSTAVNYLTNLPVGTLSILFNIPLYILGYFSEGKSFVMKSAYATAALAMFIDAFAFIPHVVSDLLLSAVFGGAMAGAGYGLVLAFGATTGGSDIIAKLVNKKRRHISMGSILFVIDAAVIAFAAFTFRNLYTALYSVIALYISSKVIDLLLEGVNFAKLAIIITDKSAETAGAITRTINRGATYLSGSGVYTGKRKNLIMCSLKKNEITMLKSIVAGIDPRAFVIITDVREVLGEGFMNM